MPDFDNKDPGDWTTALINDYIELSPENHLQDPGRERAFDRPLVGFASGGDPIFEGYKTHVGPLFVCE